MKILNCLHNRIRNLRTPSYTKGKFGYQCSKSKPLEYFSQDMYKNIHLLSTPDEIGDTYLKGSFEDALATKGVHNCAYLSLYDNKNKIQVIYHVFAYKNKTEIKKIINKLMPNGFDKACIIAGDSPGTEYCAKEIFAAVKSIKKSVRILYRHFNQDTPTIISYNGKVYAMSNNSKNIIMTIPNSKDYLCNLLV